MGDDAMSDRAMSDRAMSDRASTDLDAALAALARAERVARPMLSDALRARVLSDAAQVAAQVSAEIAAEMPTGRQAASPRRARRRVGLLGWLGGFDAWAGAALAMALICLALGLGLGYGAGEALLAEAGLGESFRMAEAAEEDALLLSEDVL